MEKAVKVVGAVTIALALVAFAAVLGAYPTKWIVNYLFTGATLAAVFGVTKISVWQALWLNVLCGWLIKSTHKSDK